MLKLKSARFATLVRREAHYFQAGAYILGVAAYQVVTLAGGFDVVEHWTVKDWAGHAIVALGPAILFLLRGQHASADEIAAAVHRGEAP